jgi:hypothetical protein
MDEIQKVLVKAGRKDLAQKYYLKVANIVTKEQLLNGLMHGKYYATKLTLAPDAQTSEVAEKVAMILYQSTPEYEGEQKSGILDSIGDQLHDLGFEFDIISKALKIFKKRI